MERTCAILIRTNLTVWSGQPYRYRGLAVPFKRNMQSKSIGICKTYSDIAYAYAKLLNDNDEIVDIATNVFLEGLVEGEYTSDFLCTKTDGTKMVRECIDRKNLGRPKNAMLLDASKNYWYSRGIVDWGIVINE